MPQFKFELGQLVTIAASGERGVVKGRGEYTNSANTYYLQYKAADGRACTVWWDEDALVSTCTACGGCGLVRQPYSFELEPCTNCASRPSSTASDTTDASVNGSGSNA